MKYAIGCDIVKISRVEKLFATTSAERVFHKSEITGHNMQHLAGIFAAKEAAIKALDLSVKHWLDFEVTYSKNGRPQVTLLRNTTQQVILDVSISHEDDYAMAVVLAMEE